jgi:glc operon protein GlcG
MKLSERQDVIGAAAAHAAVWAAVEAGYAMDIGVNAAVVDAGGNLAAFLRAPGAFLHSIAFAQDKATTAAGFGVATDGLYEMVKDEPRLREGLSRADRLSMIGGGLPLLSDGRIIGGIGVSGGSEAQDIECCKAALRALGLPDG